MTTIVAAATVVFGNLKVIEVKNERKSAVAEGAQDATKFGPIGRQKTIRTRAEPPKVNVAITVSEKGRPPAATGARRARV